METNNQKILLTGNGSQTLCRRETPVDGVHPARAYHRLRRVNPVDVRSGGGPSVPGGPVFPSWQNM